MNMFVFGPIRSRRLGRSLGVNNIPYKTCTYNCIYCQLGRTTNLTIARRCFYNWRDVVKEVVDFLNRFRDEVDYVTIVPDGEPTLDICIGKIVEGIKKEVDVKIAVLTNASLLWIEDVRSDLMEVDYISIKVDVVDKKLWKAINRPYPVLRFEDVLNGILEFSKKFKKVLVSETMLVHGMNTGVECYEEIAQYLKDLNLGKVFISIPIRPPAESYIKPPREEELVESYEVFSRIISREKVELLNIPEPPPDNVYGDPETWLLNTTSIHPLRYDYALKVLEKICSNPEEVVENLVKKELINKVQYLGVTYLLRNFKKSLQQQ
jgi:wyosine [tRNA(Phe)-imidazoG37] synthetase (radical SAM superfamily)